MAPLSVGPWNVSARWCWFLSFFAPSQGGVPDESTFLSLFAPSQGGVPECRSVELLSAVVLSVRSLALSHLLRKVSLSVGPWNISARGC